MHLTHTCRRSQGPPFFFIYPFTMLENLDTPFLTHNHIFEKSMSRRSGLLVANAALALDNEFGQLSSRHDQRDVGGQ